MATTTNYGWTTPDDTALVKDGASAIRTLGSSVDTTTKALNPSTTLGDIEYRSSTANTNTRLGIGSTGNVLTVAGGVPTWAAPATPSAPTTNYTLINTGGTALTGATTITVSGLSGYNKLFVYVSAASTGAGSDMSIRFNSDSASNYFYNGFYLGFGTLSGGGFPSSSGSSFSIGKAASAASDLGASFYIDAANSTGNKVIQGWGTGTGSGAEGWLTNGYYSGSSVISSVSIISSSTNFDAGTIFIYGAN